MDVTQLLSRISNSFIARYEMRSRSVEDQFQGLKTEPTEVAASGNFEPPKLDTINISAEGLELGRNAASSDAAAVPPTSDVETGKVGTPVADEAPVVKVTDDNAESSNPELPQVSEETEEVPESATPASISMRSNLDIRMKLQFSMRSIIQMAQRIENGETTSTEELKQASFGLKADFRARGMTRTEVRGGDEVEQGHGHHGDVSRFRSKTKLSLRRAGGYQAQGADFNLRGFFKENMRVRDSLKIEQHGDHQIATHKFEMRYKFDSTFNIEHMNTFNAQTEKMAESDEGKLQSFLTQAGNVAETGTTEMMASFFDTVDGYLKNAEDQMLASANAFLNAAAGEMGEGFASMGIKELITSRIESFFDAVETAVTSLKTMFMGPGAVEEVIAIDDVVAQPEVSVGDPAVASEEASKVFA